MFVILLLLSLSLLNDVGCENDSSVPGDDGLVSSTPISSENASVAQVNSSLTPTMSTSTVFPTLSTDATDVTDRVIANSTGFGSTTQLQTTVPVTTQAWFSLDNANSCVAEPFHVKRVCDIPAKMSQEITLEFIAETVFNSFILGELKRRCVNNTWCLASEVDALLGEDGEPYLRYCSLVPCLQNMTLKCVNERRSLYLSTLSLLCDSTTNMTEHCRMSIRRLAHVELLQDYQGITNACTEREGRENGPTETCRMVKQQLHCTCRECNNNAQILHRYKRWQWFFTTEMTCEDNGNNCLTRWAIDWPPKAWSNKVSLYFLNEMDAKVKVGVATAVLITMGGMAAVLWACVKKIRHQKEYSREKVGYSIVTSDLTEAGM